MNRLKELRKIKNVNQATVAEYLRIDRTSYTKYENGLYDPSVDTIKKLADYFEVSIDYLLGRTETTEVKIGPNDLRKYCWRKHR